MGASLRGDGFPSLRTLTVESVADDAAAAGKPFPAARSIGAWNESPGSGEPKTSRESATGATGSSNAAGFGIWAVAVAVSFVIAIESRSRRGAEEPDVVPQPLRATTETTLIAPITELDTRNPRSRRIYDGEHTDHPVR